MSRVAVDVLIPAMLHAVVGSKRLRVEAATLAEAVEAAFRAAPALRFHLCEDDGRFRPHVLCFLNDHNTRDMKNLNVELREGDEVAFVAAISGGATAGE
ncbi:MAG: MoaD/ThiS family protein [Planctomycetes bacterium]|nr:MoaD/ThiS family protein [Planctomycetota bacterium]